MPVQSRPVRVIKRQLRLRSLRLEKLEGTQSVSITRTSSAERPTHRTLLEPLLPLRLPLHLATSLPKIQLKLLFPGDPDYDSDHEMEDSLAPTFANTILTEAEKIDAIKTQAAHKSKHTR
jgi:hypothetical protein